MHTTSPKKVTEEGKWDPLFQGNRVVGVYDQIWPDFMHMAHAFMAASPTFEVGLAWLSLMNLRMRLMTLRDPSAVPK